jgi:hypothetical protein
VLLDGGTARSYQAKHPFEAQILGAGLFERVRDRVVAQASARGARGSALAVVGDGIEDVLVPSAIALHVRRDGVDNLYVVGADLGSLVAQTVHRSFSVSEQAAEAAAFAVNGSQPRDGLLVLGRSGRRDAHADSSWRQRGGRRARQSGERGSAREYQSNS